MSKQWIALIPAYKPSEVLLQLLKEAVANDFYLIVVDDGRQQTVWCWFTGLPGLCSLSLG